MKYRSRTEIVSQMLEAANGGSTKTKIMYKAFLSHAQLKDYLAIMVENGLLDYRSDEQIYVTTQKGLRFLKIYYQIAEFTSWQEISELPRIWCNMATLSEAIVTGEKQLFLRPTLEAELKKEMEK